jgi:hypothetical protein
MKELTAKLMPKPIMPAAPAQDNNSDSKDKEDSNSNSNPNAKPAAKPATA